MCVCSRVCTHTEIWENVHLKADVSRHTWKREILICFLMLCANFTKQVLCKFLKIIEMK